MLCYVSNNPGVSTGTSVDFPLLALRKPTGHGQPGLTRKRKKEKNSLVSDYYLSIFQIIKHLTKKKKKCLLGAKKIYRGIQ